jgi:hypothetical protein
MADPWGGSFGTPSVWNGAWSTPSGPTPPQGPGNWPTAVPLGVGLWNSAQDQSAAYAETTNFNYDNYIADHTVLGVVVFAPGEGSVPPSSFVTTGTEPNSGNEPTPEPNPPYDS